MTWRGYVRESVVLVQELCQISNRSEEGSCVMRKGASISCDGISGHTWEMYSEIHVVDINHGGDSFRSPS